ncbi:MAG: hypothetical protein JW993_17665 [Sedimentisphaerales bacterium]|nr:hypothetical protein [Sedimentisphaerales bacterium]
MIEKRTVFILGAGASRPYGLPTANELRCDIISDFRKSYGNHLIAYREAEKERVRRGYPMTSDATAFLVAFDGPNNMESIDLFLSRQPRFQRIGKLAISLNILRHERESRFGHNAEKPDRDWYSLVYHRMTLECISKDGYRGFGRNKVAFVTFNYDRSLEHFLFRSLHSFEDATSESVREQIGRIAISHVYGKLAPLPWQDSDSSRILEYGADDVKSYGKLPDMIQNLYVVHEERVNPGLEEAREKIEGAERVFFLGFGYAKENLEALGFPDVVTKSHRIYGTAMGWTPREIGEIRWHFIDAIQRSGSTSAHVDKQVQIRDCDCVTLLREFL